MKRKGLGVLLATAAVAVALAVPGGAGAAVTCPDGSTATNEPGGVKSCDDSFIQGQGEPAKSEKDVTVDQKGSFNSSHPTTTCVMPPPQGKCTTE
jgi:hypothetical protein